MGRAAARCFAERGDRVALLARGEAGLAGAADEAASLVGTPLVVPVDIAAAVEAAAARVEAELGAIDIWLNNAMTAVLGFVDDAPAEEFRRVTEVTYLGQVHGTLAALRHMLARDRARSSRSARRSPTEASRCRQPTAQPSTP